MKKSYLSKNPMAPYNLINQIPNIVPSNPIPSSIPNATIPEFKFHKISLQKNSVPKPSENEKLRRFSLLRKRLGGL